MTLFDTAAAFILSVLFNSVWQTLLFAVVASLLLRLRPTANATTRHSVYVAALAAGVLLPIATAALPIAHAPPVIEERGQAGAPNQMRSAYYAPHDSGAATSSRVSVASDRSSPPTGVAVALPALPHVHLVIARNVALAIVALWLTCATVVFARLAISLLHLERLKRDALPVDVAYRAELPRCAAAIADSRRVRLCRSEQIAVPIAVGLGDAMILLPENFLTAFEPHDIDAIVLHELAHLRRGDDWFNVLGRCAGALLFFNPAVLWLVAQLDLEREVACDDWVLQQQGALPYATCLARVVETAGWPHHAATAPGAFVTRRGMSVRIERLLANDRDIRVRTGAGIAVMTLATFATIGTVALVASPSIAYPISTPLPVAAAPAVPPVAPAAALASPFVSVRVRTLRSSPIVPSAARAVASRPASPAQPEPRPCPPPIPKSTLRTPSTPPDSRTTVALANVHGAQAVADLREAVADANVDRAQAAADRKQLVAEAKSPDYIDELAAVGYTGLSAADLVQLKSLGITASLIRSWQAAGVRGVGVADLVRLRALGIDGVYIRAIRHRYGNATSIDDILSMRAIGVSSDYVDALSASGMRGLTLDDARSLRVLDVTPSFVRELFQAGYAGLTVEQIQQLRVMGIDGAFIARAATHGYHHPSIDELVQLKVTGVL